MKNALIILIFSLLCLTIKAQDDCEKFKSEPSQKIFVKIAHVSSITNGIKSFMSFGVESSYYISLNKKDKFGINIGLAYYYRTLMQNDYSGNYDEIDVTSMRVYDFSITHQTIELPVSIKYNLFKNKLCGSSFSFYAGASLIYLIKGQLSFTKPALEDFVTMVYIPKESYTYNYSFGTLRYENNFNEGIRISTFFPSNNLKVTTGFEYFIKKNIGIGLEGNYFFKPIGKTFRSQFNINQRTKPNYKNLSLLIIIKF